MKRKNNNINSNIPSRNLVQLCIILKFVSAICFTVKYHQTTNIRSVQNNYYAPFKSTTIFINESRQRSSLQITELLMSLKPAAVPLMDSGKALARSGELIIELTTALDIYGGGLSAVGAQIRNAGDCIAQAAASCRFKTATELVVDEIRESATCLNEASIKLQTAIEEANVDNNIKLAKILEIAKPYVDECSTELEAAGEGIMKRVSLNKIGSHLVTTSEKLEQLSKLIPEIIIEYPNNIAAISAATDASIRLVRAATQMKIAGNELMGIRPEPTKGRSFLKGGL